MLNFFLELQVLLGVCHLSELLELLSQLHIVSVQLLAFQSDLQCFQLLGSQLGRQCFGREVAGEVTVTQEILQQRTEIRKQGTGARNTLSAENYSVMAKSRG